MEKLIFIVLFIAASKLSSREYFETRKTKKEIKARIASRPKAYKKVKKG